MEQDMNFINKYIENLAAELMKEQREKVILKTQLAVALQKIDELESEKPINSQENKE